MLRAYRVLVGFCLCAVTLGAGACAALGAPASGLPRTYQVQRIDAPNPIGMAGFGGGLVYVGDLNGDGVADFAVGVQAGSPGNNGEVLLFSGKTGALFDTIVAPDGGGLGQASAQFGIPFISTMPDIGSCPGKTTGQLCTNPIGPADGVPELLIGARGVDTDGQVDVGRAYVYDGATRALMKRIDMPPADATALSVSSGGAWFGRAVIAPTGLPPCAGNGGVGACVAMPGTVRIGDMDGGGLPDIVIGASHYTEDSATAYPTSNCAQTPGAACIGAGRAYVYRGEDIAGSDPNVILNTPLRTYRNPYAQADNPTFPDPTANRELFANAIAPVGDVGSCTTPGIAAGDQCPAGGISNIPDGRPDVVISDFRVDLQVAHPDPAYVDVGVDLLIDGRTGAILYTYQHPEPQAGAILGSSLGGPPVGDLGDSPLPDVYLSAVTQNGQYKGQGKGYVMSGNLTAFSSTINFSILNDPTPTPGGNFGGGYTAVGNLVDEPGQFRNELLIGQSNLGEPGNPDLIGAVHVFDPLKAQVLQTIPDPDQSPGSRFGSDIISLGDINGDGFDDFAVSAPSFAGVAGPGQGRIYIFSSDNSPLPPTSASPPSIAGSAVQGLTLTEAHATWSNTPTSYTYQWEDCDGSGNSCTAISGATGQTYTLVSSDIGHTIRVQESASNAGGTGGPVSSVQTSPVTLPGPSGAPVNSSPPRVTGTATSGDLLSETVGSWTGAAPISFAEQWQRCASSCVSIRGATRSTYRLVAADVGDRVRVVVTASNSFGNSRSTSSQVGPIAPTTAEIRSGLLSQITPRGSAAKISALLRKKGYAISFKALSAGQVEIDWYLQSSGKSKRVVVATGTATLSHAGTFGLTIKLTPQGKQLLEHSGKLHLTAKATFTPRGKHGVTATKQFTIT